MGNGANGESTPLVPKHVTLEIKSEGVPVPILFHLKEAIHAVDLHHNLETVVTMHVKVRTFQVLCKMRPLI